MLINCFIYTESIKGMKIYTPFNAYSNSTVKFTNSSGFETSSIVIINFSLRIPALKIILKDLCLRVI